MAESITQSDEGTTAQEFPVSWRLQSPLVFTALDGKILTRDNGKVRIEVLSGRCKHDTDRIKNQLKTRIGEVELILRSSKHAAKTGANSHRVRQVGFSTPQPQSKRAKGASYCISSPLTIMKTPFRNEYGNNLGKPHPPMSARKLRLKAAAQVRILEVEENHVSQKAQARRDLCLERQERAYTAWLNFLLDKPSKDGIVPSKLHEQFRRCSNSSSRSTDCESPLYGSSIGKEVSKIKSNVLRPLNGIESRGYISNSECPTPLLKKKQGELTPRKIPGISRENSATPQSTSKKLSMIWEHDSSQSWKSHLEEVSNKFELRQRLKLQFTHGAREEILTTISQLAKHIDEGRLRMKEGCAILADVALRKKALNVLLNYNAVWLRFGLYVVLGHGSILSCAGLDVLGTKYSGEKKDFEAEHALLEVYLERQMFAHAGLAKLFATNKSVDGLYRKGYFEALGRVILKRFFLLVLVLDKAKCLSTLSISDGIDGVDGGSLPLFRTDAEVKSSRQALQEFLSDVMHGEGDVIGNLNALGYQVYHCQNPLVDYQFHVENLIEDLQNGVRLCRIVQLLANDTSVLIRMQLPSVGMKRNLQNCQTALESFAQAGVPLEDEEGNIITAENIASGDKEKIFSLLWSIIVHLQMPMLMSRPRLCQEISNLQGTKAGFALGLNVGTTELLLKWTQVICLISGGPMVRNFKTSFADGQALCYLIKFYLPHLMSLDAILDTSTLISAKDLESNRYLKTSDIKGAVTPIDHEVLAHNFGMVQSVANKLGNIPKVLELQDLQGDAVLSERNIVLYVAFLCSKLLSEAPLNGHGESRVSPSVWNTATTNPEFDTDAVDESADSPSSSPEKAVEKIINVIQVGHESKCERDRRSIGIQISSSNVQDWDRVRSQVSNQYTTLNSICRIQAKWRAFLVRKDFTLQKTAAQKIQCAWRNFRAERTRFPRPGCIALHVRCSQMESNWRGYPVNNDSLKDEAATLIQSCYRRHMQRRVYQTCMEAAKIIQAHFRTWIGRRGFQATVRSICQIQALSWAREARGHFLIQKEAVHKIELAWLKFKTRREHVSALKIQDCWQGYRRRVFAKRNAAASVIQSCFRGHSQKRIARGTRQSVLIIQAHYRAWVQRMHFRADLVNICKIQAWWRAFESRRRFLAQRRAALTIQWEWRQFMVRVRHNAAFKIQLSWRRHRKISLLSKSRAAAMLIQSRYRGYIQKVKYRNCREAVLHIQLSYRIWFQRRMLKATILRKICKIQALWRGHSARGRFLLLKGKVQKIQRSWRQHLAHKRYVAPIMLYLRRRKAAICLLQRWYRGHLTRRLLKAHKEGAIKTRFQFRAWVHNRNLQEVENKVSKVQALWRAKKSCAIWLVQTEAAHVIQQKWRQFVARKLERHAIKLQAAWRAFSGRRQFLQQKAAITLCQRCCRGHIVRAQFHKHRHSVIVLQANIRGWLQRKRYREIVSKVSRIQSFFKGHLARKSYLAKQEAAQAIQQEWKAFATRRRVRSAVLLQAAWRGFAIRKLVSRWKTASIRIQTSYRDYRRWKSCKYTNAVTTIQAAVKGMLVRRSIRVYQANIIAIQAIARGKLTRKRLGKQKEAASLIQFSYRSRLTRAATSEKENHRILSVAIIQAAWRRYLVSKSMRMSKLHPRAVASAVALSGIAIPNEGFVCKEFDQSEVEACQILIPWLKSVSLRVRFLRLRRCATLIQSHIRGWIKRKLFIGLKQSAILVQSHWRGYMQRRGHDRLQQQLLELRHRMQQTATSVHDSNRLGNRLTEALALLLSQKTVSGILKTCATIDLATKHSKACCEQIAKAGAITKLLQLIQTTNRSPPHEQVLKHALSILCNLARSAHLGALLAEAPSSMGIITGQLHMFRNNEQVFAKAVLLLHLVSKVPMGAKILQETPLAVRRLHHVTDVLERKVQVEKRNVERLPHTTAAARRKAAEKKASEAASQYLSTVSLIKRLNNKQAIAGPSVFLTPSVRKKGNTLSCLTETGSKYSFSASRFPLRDRTNCKSLSSLA